VDTPANDANRGHDPLDRIVTTPNIISLIRILSIPAFVALLAHHGTEEAGLILLAAVVATDWVDGYIARRTGQVSNVGKLLDPVADRLAITAALVTLVVRHAFPLWAALLVIVRDGAILVVGLVLLISLRVRLDVRRVGKAATLALMFGIPLVSWGAFGLFLHGPARVAGWAFYWVGIVLYYVAAVVYGADLLREVRLAKRAPGDPGAVPR
jgi:cardiolipin synthase